MPLIEALSSKQSLARSSSVERLVLELRHFLVSFPVGFLDDNKLEYEQPRL